MQREEPYTHRISYSIKQYEVFGFHCSYIALRPYMVQFIGMWEYHEGNEPSTGKYQVEMVKRSGVELVEWSGA